MRWTDSESRTASRQGGRMRARTILASVAVFFAAVGLSFAADPQMGTWKLNEAKSKLSPEGGKVTTVVYEAVGDNVKVTVDGLDKDGKPTHNEWTGKFDGKDYPVSGGPSLARSYKKIDAYTMSVSYKEGGKEVSTGRIVVA